VESATGYKVRERLSRLPRLGLRSRLVAALVATAAATLAVAALALLSPLEHKLRNEDVKFLTQNALAALPTVRELDATQAQKGSPELNHVIRGLERRTGARVIMFNRAGQVLVDTDPDSVASGPEGGPLDDVHRALITGRRTRDIREVGPGGEARVSLPVDVGGSRYVIALRRSLEQTHSAVTVVKRAFLTAAVVGLALALVLGIALANTLLRRLRRLRDAASNISFETPQSELPHETNRDEVGELARALSAMQERLRQEEAVRRAFVATASHELRTPLASLGAMLELVDDDLTSQPPDLEDAGPRVSAARAQTRRMITLANDLLELTRLDTGFVLRSEPVELHEVCRAVIAELGIRAAERHVPLELKRNGSDSWVTGDPDAIARIVRILIDNALRFSPEGEPVTVSVAEANGNGSVEVADHGPGIRPEEQELVFERFKRGTDAGGEGGFGLGLAIGRELAERMEGELDVAALNGAGGGRFVLTLPST
jgi:signal transduction histidine kinase